MKKIYSMFIAFLCFALLGCKDSNNQDPEETAASELEGTWSANGGQVTVDGTDLTSDYTSFAITFTETKDGEHIYTVANGGNAFKDISVDTWSFTDNTYSLVERGDGVVMKATRADNMLTLQFTINDHFQEGGRVKGMFGDFVMKLKKK